MRKPTTPGEILLEEFINPYKISRKTLADHLGWNVKRIDRICNNQSVITAEKAVALGMAFRISPEFWLNAQAAIDLYKARRASKSITPLPCMSGCIPKPRSLISIDKNIKITPKCSSQKHSGVPMYPFAEMQIGDSFLLECHDVTNKKAMERLRSRATSNLSLYNRRRGANIKIATRATDDGIRVWRI